MAEAKLSGLSDVELILIYQGSKDPDSFAELYNRYETWARRTLVWKCGGCGLSEEDAEDIFIDSWTKVFRSLPEFDCNKGTFKGWLGTILARTLIDYSRSGSAYRRNLPSVNIIGDDRVQKDQDHFYQLSDDFRVEEIIELQAEMEDLRAKMEALINRCFRSAKRRELALYELGFGPLPEEYRHNRRAYEKAKSDIKSTLRKMWQAGN